ncbi:hypothetical protein AOC36_07665 [Erysipelothrix larvae]|uniref:Uncharacterized protein n=1 Tax=Erysipelothrix larvae TaxID=1514105 RepID=A0A0X8H0J7_9FIRM|nr:aspartate/glutamate racemase family protein [Erysipelothrix larvae]AMC93864.1 hypothetical protein AOC36_07665 [Erysipelothrix larvae]
MKKIRKLGLFDSGLGGYTIFKDLKEHFPMLSLTLYADQKRAPIGNLSNDEIIELASLAMEWFNKHGIYDVLLACNTATSVALPELKRRYPTMRIWGIIDLTINALPDNARHVAVLATQATVSSHAYSKAYHRNHLGEIIEKPLPLLASAIESLIPEKEIELMIYEGLENLTGRTHIILGCTHYPLVKHLFLKTTDAQIVDSIEPIRTFIQAHYESDGLPTHRVFTTGDPQHMKEQIKQLYRIHEEVYNA